MNTREITTRLRLGLALVAGFALGKALAITQGHHTSEFFVAGFAVGVLLTQGLFRLAGRGFRRDKASGRSSLSRP